MAYARDPISKFIAPFRWHVFQERVDGVGRKSFTLFVGAKDPPLFQRYRFELRRARLGSADELDRLTKTEVRIDCELLLDARSEGSKPPI
jgi:hypothetical protein